MNEFVKENNQPVNESFGRQIRQKDEGRQTPDKNDGQQMQKRFNQPALPYPVLGAASVIYALFYTFCLYRNASGITYPFFVVGTLVYFFFCMKKFRVLSGSKAGLNGGQTEPEQANFPAGTRDNLTVIFYELSICLLGISVCLTDDNKILWMTKTGIFLLTITLTLRLFYRTKGWNFTKYLCAICRSLMELLHYIDTPFADAAVFLKERDKTVKNKNVKYIFIGILAAVPLLIIILALLLSADAVFLDLFERILGDIDLSSIILICLMALTVYVLFYSFVRGLITYRMPEKEEKEKSGEPVAAITFTSLIAVIYLIFCAIQVVYLFMGKMELPDGMTWASYARQGFFQLLFVCLINLVMVLVCLACFKESRILKVILTAISLMTYILIASSAYRMILYILNYYLTFLRLFVLWSLAVIAILLMGIIISIYRKTFPLFGFCTAVITICYIVLAFAKPDYWVAKYDLAHAGVTYEIESADGTREIVEGFDDYWYLSKLSADAAPLLAQEDVGKMWEDTGASRLYYGKILEKCEDINLRNFNFSRWKAKKSLENWYGAAE